MRKKIAIVIGSILLVAVIVVSVLVFISQQPISKDEALTHFTTYFEKVSKPTSDFSGVQALVFSQKLDIDWKFAKGNSHRSGQLTLDQPFHGASVGKLFTAIVIYQLEEEGKLSLEDSVSSYIARDVLRNLFYYEGTDYTELVTFTQLLAHTSGVADYFAGPVTSGESVTELLKNESDKLWQPQDLLNVSVLRQTPVSVPGEGYLYSDTGYVLLGLIIEEIEGKSFEAVLEDRFFKPLKMDSSFMAMRSEPLSGISLPLADLWLDGEEFGDAKALSIDWSGGGVISTLEDLLSFSKALHSGQLISEASLNLLFSKGNKFEQGIYTGVGGMVVYFKEFFPLLDLPVVQGHIGILGTHLFYDPTTQTHIVLNFGSTSKLEPSFMALIEILSVLKRISI
jgi:D-alanyl-D-alanine carboxypeptidase